MPHPDQDAREKGFWRDPTILPDGGDILHADFLNYKTQMKIPLLFHTRLPRERRDHFSPRLTPAVMTGIIASHFKAQGGLF